MAAGIDAKTVNTHLDELAIALTQIAVRGGVLGIQVHTVAGYLGIPPCVVVPVEVAEVVV